MPGPFTHIYTARRVADFLRSDVTDEFIRPSDGQLRDEQKLLPELVAALGRKKCAEVMDTWEKFTAVGAIGPDLFFFLQDYNKPWIPCDEIMLAMNLLYYLDDNGYLEDPWDGILTILSTEVPDGWAKILRFIVALRKIWRDFKEIYDETIGPIIDKVGEVIDDLGGNLLTALADAMTALKEGIIALAQKELLTEVDLFSWFSLKMRGGVDEQAFCWSDMTHYRRTSVIPARLVEKARGMMNSEDKLTREHGDQLLAFSMGWIAHAGTDVVAHSFVNEQCGGPFRTHWQRHHLIENHIDAWNYQCTKDGRLPQDSFIGWQPSYPSVADSALYFACQIPQNIDDLPADAPPSAKQGDLRVQLPEGTDKSSQKQIDKLLETEGALPLWLAEAIAQTLIEVYAEPDEGGDGKLQASLNEGSVKHPRNLKGQTFQDDLKSDTALLSKWLSLLDVDNIAIGLEELRETIAPDPAKTTPEGFPFPWEIQTAYRFMLSWFKRSYVSGMNMDKPEPPGIDPPDLADLLPDGPPDFSGVDPADDPISQTCEVLLALLEWVVKALAGGAKFLYDLVKAAAQIATYPARWDIYHFITEPVWQATEHIRMVLVHLGYIQPQSEMLWPSGNLRRPNEVDETLIRLGHSVNSAFDAALQDAVDVLGNLDKDPELTNPSLTREVLGVPNPWLPVRTAPGTKPPVPNTAIFGDNVVEYLRPWGFPAKNNEVDPAKAGNFLEGPLTIAGPYPRDTMPDTILRTNGTSSNKGRNLYESAGCPNDTHLYNREYILHEGDRFRERTWDGDDRRNPLGDPVNFSAYLIGQIAHNPSFVTSNFNLDADRGYGYLCWDWERDRGLNLHVEDERGNAYVPPLTWPEGAKKDGRWPQDDAKPVGINMHGTATKSLDVSVVYFGRTGCKESDKPVSPPVVSVPK